MATLGGGATDDFERRLSELRYAAITEALPAPHGPVAATDLQDFKEKHAEQLKRCRVHLDGKLADLAAMEHDQLRQVKAASILQEIQDDVASLLERMQKRRWPMVLLVGVGGVVAAGLAIATTVATGGTALALGLGVGAGVVPLGGAVAKAGEIIKEPRYNPRAPLAYAALAARL
jgi:hypothetical protein